MDLKRHPLEYGSDLPISVGVGIPNLETTEQNKMTNKDNGTWGRSTTTSIQRPLMSCMHIRRLRFESEVIRCV